MTEDEAPKAPVRVGKTRLITIDDLDRRTNAAKTALETKNSIMADLGGSDQLSTLERLAAEHAALAAAVTQDAYARWLTGQEVSLPEIATMSGITKSEERSLRAALARLQACNRRPYLGGNERYAIDMAIMGIKQRLEPTPVHQLLSAADKICEPLERLLRDIDAQQAALEVVG